MDLVLDFRCSSAFEFYHSYLNEQKSFEYVDDLIGDFGSDEDLIQHELELKYNSDDFFILVDYNSDEDEFHIRVWEIEE